MFCKDLKAKGIKDWDAKRVGTELAKYTICSKFIDITKQALVIEHLYEEGKCNSTNSNRFPANEDIYWLENQSETGKTHSNGSSNEIEYNTQSDFNEDLEYPDYKSLNSRGCDDQYNKFEEELASDPNYAPDSIEFGCQQPDFIAELEFTRHFMSLNEQERMIIGHNFTGFIKECTYQGRNCLNEK